jgi:hypothetical protein
LTGSQFLVKEESSKSLKPCPVDTLRHAFDLILSKSPPMVIIHQKYHTRGISFSIDFETTDLTIVPITDVRTECRMTVV